MFNVKGILVLAETHSWKLDLGEILGEWGGERERGREEEREEEGGRGRREREKLKGKGGRQR